jgi:hypothetical protein
VWCASQCLLLTETLLRGKGLQFIACTLIKKGIMHIVDERWVTVVVHMNSIHIMNAKGLHFFKFKILSTKVPILD